MKGPMGEKPEKHSMPTRIMKVMRPVARYMKPRFAAIARAKHDKWSSNAKIRTPNAKRYTDRTPAEMFAPDDMSLKTAMSARKKLDSTFARRIAWIALGSWKIEMSIGGAPGRSSRYAGAAGAGDENHPGCCDVAGCRFDPPGEIGLVVSASGGGALIHDGSDVGGGAALAAAPEIDGSSNGLSSADISLHRRGERDDGRDDGKDFLPQICHKKITNFDGTMRSTKRSDARAMTRLALGALTLAVVATAARNRARLQRPATSARPPGPQRDREEAKAAAVRRYQNAARREDAARAAEARARPLDASRAFDPRAFGAVADGVADDARALEAAVRAAAAAGGVALVPAGVLLRVSAVRLVGLANFELRIDGAVRAFGRARWPARPPDDASLSPERQRVAFGVLELVACANATVTGAGTVEGVGRDWWRARKRTPSIRAPVLLLVRDSYDVAITHLSLVDSPFYHCVVVDSSSIRLRRLRVESPSSSTNTDGVDVLASEDVRVEDCWISTGDDNVAIKEGSNNVIVRGGVFHAGHGLSLGSLGERGTAGSISNVRMSDVTFVRTTNAARVKTWQGGTGSVRNVTFANLTVRAVAQPLVIDQFYCPASQHPGPCANSSQAVAIEAVTVDGLRGWHTSGVAAMLHCSDARPCDVTVRNLDLRGAPGCSNVVRCWSVARSRDPAAVCGGGNAMHGYQFGLSARQRRALFPNATCVYPP